MRRLPVVFVSHGSPMLLLERSHPAHQFLAGAAGRWPRPKAVLGISPHWHSAEPMLSAARQPETIHDFFGFDQELYDMTYPAPGAPDIAVHAASLLEAAGISTTLHPSRGRDHGIWAPLRLLYPSADLPLCQLSQQSHRPPAYHMDIGRALAPLRDMGVLIFASGTLTHNTGMLDRSGKGPIAPWAKQFAGWIADRLEARDDDALAAYRSAAPGAVESHPTDDHLLPLFTALGAATPGVPPVRLHASFLYGSLSMDAYLFD